MPLPILQNKWPHLSIDFLTDLPAFQGFTAIMVVLDSRWRRGQLQHLVDSEGHGPMDWCWVPARDILDQNLKQEFHHSYPDQPALCFRSHLITGHRSLLGVSVRRQVLSHPGPHQTRIGALEPIPIKRHFIVPDHIPISFSCYSFRTLIRRTINSNQIYHHTVMFYHYLYCIHFWGIATFGWFRFWHQLHIFHLHPLFQPMLICVWPVPVYDDSFLYFGIIAIKSCICIHTLCLDAIITSYFTTSCTTSIENQLWLLVLNNNCLRCPMWCIRNMTYFLVP